MYMVFIAVILRFISTYFMVLVSSGMSIGRCDVMFLFWVFFVIVVNIFYVVGVFVLFCSCLRRFSVGATTKWLGIVFVSARRVF